MIRFWNNIKTALLLGSMMGICLLIGSRWGAGGAAIGLVLGLGINLFTFFFSDKIALASMRAVEVTPNTPGTGRELYLLVDELRQRAGLPMPRVYICPQEAPNAFATGRSPSKAAVAVTEGALSLLNYEELRGVMAHELAHVKNRDTLISCIAAAFAGIIAYFAQLTMFMGGNNREGGNPLIGLLGLILAPIGAAIVQAMISRSREYVADADGAKIAGSPIGLMNALQRLEMYSKRIPMDNPNPAQNSLFIIEPFVGGLTSLFATHPKTADRIAALQTVRIDDPTPRRDLRPAAR